ncbi:hypothetical protein C366_03268 [Cryptococcus neoformans Tu401-1]|uniref:Uncharacterized protein n=1 Tax=Cryptococcus neoformans Tu259-1 TaxID=1230072 RepID=A0A854QDN6_CRYNE|nr:hypothetical protein C368_03313 [Cryptococcus neoformans var. grubii 125.91]OXG17866.1 hypothetical protein C366_03268 [Cryptococcus neoformans var. grubii Tu401-1]OXG21343.1 hypothetical protein C361_03561 [Cryptococcus neoformans var. grubii Tu259-1]OXG81582.1 hypothetical protein C350_03134 [Cryptococcus neoformans var. grubii MW-RSA36]OXL08394.1 hypothetical protein C348_03390 [Cryptococcus neoformans var. grubii Gb118]OXM79731.1 hypothetical protein C364_03236 [Cryptococcus neoformans 
MPSRNDIKQTISAPVSVTSTTGFNSGPTPSNTSTNTSRSTNDFSIRGQTISHPFNVTSSTGFELTSNYTANPPDASQGPPSSPSVQSGLSSAISDNSREIAFYLHNHPITPPLRHTGGQNRPAQASYRPSPNLSHGACSPPERSAWSPDSSVQGQSSRLTPSQSSNTIDSLVSGSATSGLSRSGSGLVSPTGLLNPLPLSSYLFELLAD